MRLITLLQMWSMQFNPFTWDNTSGDVHSAVLTLELKDDKRNSIEVSKLSSDVLIKIPLNSAVSVQTNQSFFTKQPHLTFSCDKRGF